MDPGPYPVTHVVSWTSYEVKMIDKRRKKRIFHINMLRPWTERVEPPEVVLLAAEDSTHEDELTVEWRNENACAPLISAPDLPNSHRCELTQLLAQFTSILRRMPFTLQTDASEFAIGAVLSQTDDDGLERSVTIQQEIATQGELLCYCGERVPSFEVRN